MNYFSIICFFWALIGLGSRVAMGIMGERWKGWETGKAYREQRPAWVVFVALAAIILIIVTWIQVVRSDIAYDWIIAVLVSLTGIKVSMFLISYETFREFVVGILGDTMRMRRLNTIVIIFSFILIGMGLFLY